MKVFVALISLFFATTSFAADAKIPGEKTIILCPAVEGIVASVVKAQYGKTDLVHYVKVVSADDKIGPYYQQFTSVSQLGDTTTVYESRDFTYTYYSFGAGKKPTLTDKISGTTLTCNVVGE